MPIGELIQIPCRCCGGKMTYGSSYQSSGYCFTCQSCEGECQSQGPVCENCGSAAMVDGKCHDCKEG